MKKIKIKSFEDAEKACNDLLNRIDNLENRESFNIQGLTEEIIYLRKETHVGFQEINSRLDELTLQSKTHTEILSTHTVALEKIVDKLDEISKKLD